MSRNLKRIAFLPAFNEELAIRRVINRILKHVDMVIVVDDGSSDKTLEIARSAGALVIRHSRNRGYGAAIKTCFSTARKMNAKWMVIIDADGQHDPDDVPNVVAPIIAGKADISIGSRFVDKKLDEVPAPRKLGIKMLNLVVSLFGPRVLDSQSGFRAYSKRAIAAIDPTDSDMGAGCEILIQAHRKNLSIVEVPAKCSYANQESHNNMIVQGFKVLSLLMRLTLASEKMIDDSSEDEN